MSIETMLFDQDYVTEMYEHELREEGREEGMQQGKVDSLIATVNQLFPPVRILVQFYKNKFF